MRFNTGESYLSLMTKPQTVKFRCRCEKTESIFVDAERCMTTCLIWYNKS